MRIFLVSLCLTVFFYSNNAFAGAYDQLPGGSVYIPPVGKPECVSGCESIDTGDDGDDDERPDPGPKPGTAHDNAQQKKRHA